MTALLVVTLFAAAAAAENWPQFRGPTGEGISGEKGLPLEWGGAERKNVRWSTPLPGEGHASPIVWGDRVIACTVPWDDDPAHRAAIPAHHVTAYSTVDGRQLWDTRVKPGSWLRNDFRSGPGGGYAAPTPCTDGRHVFVAFGSSVLAALDLADGHVVWRKEIEPHTFDVTVGGSPVLFGDTVIFLCAMAKKADSRLVAFNKADGEVRWEAKMPTVGFSHSTPVVIEAGSRPQVLVAASAMGVTPDGLQSFDPATGRRLWWCRGGGDASSPAYGDGIVYFDSGRGGPGFAVDPTGSGDVTATHVKWSVPRVTEALGSPVIAGGYVYRLQSPNVLRCWKSSIGEQVYQNRLEGITTTWASPIADADGRLFFASGGKSFVVKAGPQFEVLSVNDLNDANHASAAGADGRLYVVGRKQIYCVGRP
jgi:outer membrane protein assembly factor BamB